MDATEVFDALAAELAESHEHVERNRKGSLVVAAGGRGAVRAMTSRGSIVVKLDRVRVAEIVDQGRGTHYKGQVNEWLELDRALDAGEVRALVVEAIDASA